MKLSDLFLSFLPPDVSNETKEKVKTLISKNGEFNGAYEILEEELPRPKINKLKEQVQNDGKIQPLQRILLTANIPPPFSNESPSNSNVGDNVSSLPKPIEVSSPLIDTDHKTIIKMKDLYFSLMPKSLEKSLISLLFYANTKIIKSETLMKLEALLNFRQFSFDENIKLELGNLEKQIKTEEQNTSDINNTYLQIKNEINFNNWNAALSELDKMLKKIRPLNIKEMKRLMQKVDPAAQLVKKQKVILLLGKTGVGKSTTIQYLAGSKMVEIKVNGKAHITPVDVKNEALKSVVISSSDSSSETRFINPIKAMLVGIKMEAL